MSLFVVGADSLTSCSGKRRVGENGATELTEEGVGENLVAFFSSLVRNIPEDRFVALYRLCIVDSEEIARSEAYRVRSITDLFILAFQTRNCRGGKGERDIFYNLIILLYNDYPETVISLLPLVHEYGYFKDYFNILENIASESSVVIRPNNSGLYSAIIEFLASQLLADFKIVSNGISSTVSLCAKYAPREDTHFSSGVNKPMFKDLLAAIFPTLDEKKRKREYRKLVVAIAKSLDTAESKMCSHQFSKIDFSKTPSLCIFKFRMAFLNEAISKKRKLSCMNTENGDRFPHDMDRVKCRENFKKAISENKVKGGQLYPHQIVKSLTSSRRGLIAAELDLFNSQRSDIRAKLVASLNDPSKPVNPNSVRLDRFVPLVDVSGSMAGDPMMVAIALGILVSEVTNPLFRDRIITFESSPRWVTLNPSDSIAQKVETVRKAPWGGSTNLEAAFRLILQVVEKNKLAQDDIPDLIIFSDMQFDEAFPGNVETQYEKIRKSFYNAGMKIRKKPLDVPRIVFWNLRGDTYGYPVSATTANTQLLSGFSPSMLSLVMSGDEVKIEASDEEKVKKAEVNPYETFRKAIDHEQYDKVRLVLSNSSEKLLAFYRFKPEVENTIVGDVEMKEDTGKEGDADDYVMVEDD